MSNWKIRNKSRWNKIVRRAVTIFFFMVLTTLNCMYYISVHVIHYIVRSIVHCMYYSIVHTTVSYVLQYIVHTTIYRTYLVLQYIVHATRLQYIVRTKVHSTYLILFFGLFKYPIKIRSNPCKQKFWRCSPFFNQWLFIVRLDQQYFWPLHNLNTEVKRWQDSLNASFILHACD